MSPHTQALAIVIGGEGALAAAVIMGARFIPDKAPSPFRRRRGRHYSKRPALAAIVRERIRPSEPLFPELEPDTVDWYLLCRDQNDITMGYR